MKTHELAKRLLEMDDKELKIAVYDEDTEMYATAECDVVSNYEHRGLFLIGTVVERFTEEEWNEAEHDK